MTSHVEDLLSRAAWCTSPTPRPTSTPPNGAWPPVSPTRPRPPQRASRPPGTNAPPRGTCRRCARRSSPPPPWTSLQDAFVLAQPLPDPQGARVLGCILWLNRSHEAARDWWQYAAGDGDAAAFSLHLHHLARGERTEANWWHTQAERTPPPAARRPWPGNRHRPAPQPPRLTCPSSSPPCSTRHRSRTSASCPRHCDSSTHYGQPGATSARSGRHPFAPSSTTCPSPWATSTKTSTCPCPTRDSPAASAR